jgi:hypothetical protein
MKTGFFHFPFFRGRKCWENEADFPGNGAPKRKVIKKTYLHACFDFYSGF